METLQIPADPKIAIDGKNISVSKAAMNYKNRTIVVVWFLHGKEKVSQAFYLSPRGKWFPFNGIRHIFSGVLLEPWFQKDAFALKEGDHGAGEEEHQLVSSALKNYKPEALNIALGAGEVNEFIGTAVSYNYMKTGSLNRSKMIEAFGEKEFSATFGKQKTAENFYIFPPVQIPPVKIPNV